MRRFTRKRPDVGAETKVRCEVRPRPDPISLWAEGKRPVQDGAVVLIQASGGTQLRCQHALARQLAPGPRQKRCNRVSTRSLAHMAPPLDHFQIRRGAQLLVPMLDDAVLQPGLARRQTEEDIVVYPELGADPTAAGLGRGSVAPALWHQQRHSSRDIRSALPRSRPNVVEKMVSAETAAVEAVPGSGVDHIP